jgi:O-antigen/teichoic acid export membrane protein
VTGELVAGESTDGRSARFVRSSAFTFATNLVVALLSLANVIVVSRALGADGRGAVTFLTTITLVTATVSALGVQQASGNIAGAEPQLKSVLATNALCMSLLFGGLSAGILALLMSRFPGLEPGRGAALRWLALGAVSIMIMRTYFSVLVQADYGFRVTNAAWMIGPAVNVLLNGAMAALGVLSVGRAMLTWVGGQALGVALLLWYVQARQSGLGKPDVPLALRSVRFGLQAHAGNVMLIGNYRLDQWITGSISGERELGLYSVAVAWGEGLFFLPTALAIVQRPDVVRGTRREAARLAASACRAANILTVPLAVALFLAAPFLCVTVFGADFRGSIDDLRCLVPGAFGIVTLKLLGTALTAQGKPLLESIAIGVGFVTTIVLDVVLIPRYGGLGAAIASSIAYTAAGLTVAVVFTRSLGLRGFDLVPRPGDVPRVVRTLRLALGRLGS